MTERIEGASPPLKARITGALWLIVIAASALGGVAIGAVTFLTRLAPLALLQGDQYLGAFTTSQLQAMALTSLDLHGLGLNTGLVLFGIQCFIAGYLIVRSTFLPRILGVLPANRGLDLRDPLLRELSVAPSLARRRRSAPRVRRRPDPRVSAAPGKDLGRPPSPQSMVSPWALAKARWVRTRWPRRSSSTRTPAGIASSTPTDRRFAPMR